MFCDLKVPPLFNLLNLLPLPTISEGKRLLYHRLFILFLTFWCYVFYHASRKPFAVVKNVFLKNCKVTNESSNCTSWIAEMSNNDVGMAHKLLGILDSVYLFSYAFFMFLSGFIAERVNVRIFLTVGMIMSGVFVIALGVAKYAEIHTIVYFAVIEFFDGIFQSTGWPCIVSVVANWFGHAKKGLLFGVWNSHVSVGNILGSYIAGVYVEDDWALSFIVPGLLVSVYGFVIFFSMIVRPSDLDIVLPLPKLTSSTANASPDQPGNRSRVEDDGQKKNAISFWAALQIPGVVEFSLSLFFSKLSSYTFMFWLPTMIKRESHTFTSEQAAYLSILFDCGGIVGGIFAGLSSDYTGMSASTCVLMFFSAIPVLVGYNSYRHVCPFDSTENDACYRGNVMFLLFTGILVNGPNSLITTAVSAELGAHKSLSGNALATVAAIIDATGSLGAAFGPLVAGAIGLNNVFYMLIASDILALLFLSRIVYAEIVRSREMQKKQGKSNSISKT